MVKMVIGEVQTQTEEIKAFGQSYNQALDSVSNVTQGMMLAVGMTGEGMDSIKNYMSSVYPALCQAAILHSEATVQANENYVKGYISQCGSEDLDSEELQEQIDEADRLIQGFQSSKDNYSKVKRNLSDDKEKILGFVLQLAINSMDSAIARNQAKKTKIEEKLQKLLDFDSQSTSYFDRLEDTGKLLTDGMQDLGVDEKGRIGVGSWNGKGFSLKKRPWIKKVNQKWKERLEIRDKELLEGCKIVHVVDKKRGVDMYMNEKNGRRFPLNEKDLSGDLKDLIKKFGLDVLELSPTEMTKRVNDFQKSGRDYFTGKKVMPGFGTLSHMQDLSGRLQESGLLDAAMTLGFAGAAVRNARVYGKKASGAKIPTLNSLSDEVASSLGGKASPLKNGYKVEIPNGRKPIVVRIMDEGSGGRGKPYYRVSIDGKGSLTPEGIISSDRGLTHIDLSENSMSEITNIINNYLGRK